VSGFPVTYLDKAVDAGFDRPVRSKEEAHGMNSGLNERRTVLTGDLVIVFWRTPVPLDTRYIEKLVTSNCWKHDARGRGLDGQ
jgi:hypothetical protein